MGVGPVLAELTPCHFLIVNQLFIDRMAIELGDGLSVSSWGNKEWIAGSIVLISTVLISTVAMIPSLVLVAVSSISLVPALVSLVLSLVSAGSVVLTLVSTVWRTHGSWQLSKMAQVGWSSLGVPRVTGGWPADSPRGHLGKVVISGESECQKL